MVFEFPVDHVVLAPCFLVIMEDWLSKSFQRRLEDYQKEVKAKEVSDYYRKYFIFIQMTTIIPL